MTSRSKALGKNGPKKITSELASLLHNDASSLEEGEESRSSREATPVLSKAPSTSTVLDLEERKLTVMFEFMTQQQKRDEERGKEAEEREKVRKREAVEREEARKREEEEREKRDRLWMISLQEMEDERRRKQMEWEERRKK